MFHIVHWQGVPVLIFLRKLSPSDFQCLSSKNAKSRIGRYFLIQIFRICMTPNQTRVPGSESTKHPKYPCNTVLPRCARRKGGRHIDVPCFTYLGGGGRNGRPPIHLNYSLSNRQGPVIQFLVSGSLISLLARPAVPNHPMQPSIGIG